MAIFYLLSLVGLFVEFLEQEEEHNCVHANPPNEGSRVVTIDKQKLESVKHDENKLNLKFKKTRKNGTLIFGVTST